MLFSINVLSFILNRILENCLYSLAHFLISSLFNALESDFCLCHSTEIALAEFIRDILQLYPNGASQ